MFLRYRNPYDDYIFLNDSVKSTEELLLFFQHLEQYGGRPVVKNLLGILNPTFKHLFEKNKFKNEKEENLHYLNLLIDEFSNYFDDYEENEEFISFYNELCDANYEQTVEAEARLKEAEHMDRGLPFYDSNVYKRKKELDALLNVDSYAEAVNQVEFFKTYIFESITYIIAYYNPKTDAMRRNEIRNRDELFFYILYLLSVFYDTDCYISEENIDEALFSWYLPLSKRLLYNLRERTLLHIVFGYLREIGIREAKKARDEAYEVICNLANYDFDSVAKIEAEIREKQLKTIKEEQ